MLSMTGFGRAELAGPLGRVVVEISTLNNRFLDLSFKAPRPLLPLEARVRELAGTMLSRGKVNLAVNFEEAEDAPGKYVVNDKLARAYHRQLAALKSELKLGGDITISDLLTLPDIARPDQADLDYERYWPMLESALSRALKRLVAMRRREGKAMAADMRKILVSMPARVSLVEKQTRTVVQQQRDRLAARVGELLDSGSHDPGRLEEEIVIFAERSDITEECSRLRSHVSQFQHTLRSKEAIGKRLNFILQEMNRETNTIGSKCADYSISQTVISLKEDIEKLREMVQNVE